MQGDIKATYNNTWNVVIWCVRICGINIDFKLFYPFSQHSLIGWRSVFCLSAGVSACGAIIFTLFGSGKIQHWAVGDEEIVRVTGRGQQTDRCTDTPDLKQIEDWNRGPVETPSILGLGQKGTVFVNVGQSDSVLQILSILLYNLAILCIFTHITSNPLLQPAPGQLQHKRDHKKTFAIKKIF